MGHFVMGRFVMGCFVCESNKVLTAAQRLSYERVLSGDHSPCSRRCRSFPGIFPFAGNSMRHIVHSASQQIIIRRFTGITISFRRWLNNLSTVFLSLKIAC
jgi:hypothetical protein